MVKRFQSYVDPEEPEVPVGEEEGVALPLGDTTLTCNLGVPIIVVCCKVSGFLKSEIPLLGRFESTCLRWSQKDLILLIKFCGQHCKC